jgi:transposase InsO family protein
LPLSLSLGLDLGHGALELESLPLTLQPDFFLKNKLLSKGTHATRAIGDWISFYNHRRPHQVLDMKTPAEAFELAA